MLSLPAPLILPTGGLVAVPVPPATTVTAESSPAWIARSFRLASPQHLNRMRHPVTLFTGDLAVGHALI